MSRPLRIDIAGALYHVLSRGVERRSICSDERDFDRRAVWLARTVRTFGWKLHAFAIMPNHDHLFLESTLANLSASMHYLNGAYAGYYNRRHGRCGPLFQGRFKAHLIETDGHYREISRYIHLNPVRAGLTPRPEEWRWSSYAGYTNPAKTVPWVTYERVLLEFSAADGNDRAAYRAFVEAGMDSATEAPWSRAAEGLLVGSAEFIERTRNLLRDFPPDSARPQLSALRPRPSLTRIVEAARTTTAAGAGPAVSSGRGSDVFRAVASYIARRRYGYPAAYIARTLGFADASGVTRAVARVESNLPRFQPLLDRAMLGSGLDS